MGVGVCTRESGDGMGGGRWRIEWRLGFEVGKTPGS